MTDNDKGTEIGRAEGQRTTLRGRTRRDGRRTDSRQRRRRDAHDGTGERHLFLSLSLSLNIHIYIYIYVSFVSFLADVFIGGVYVMLGSCLCYVRGYLYDVSVTMLG